MIVNLIITGILFFLSTINVAFILFWFVSLVPAFYLSLLTFMSRRGHKSNNYIDTINNEFYPLIKEGRIVEAKKVLDENDHLVGKFYFHSNSWSDISKEFDGYKGYKPSFRVRNEAYVEYFAQTKQYVKGINFINSLPKEVRIEHTYLKYLFQLAAKDKNSCVETLGVLSRNRKLALYKERADLLNEIVFKNSDKYLDNKHTLEIEIIKNKK